MPPELRALFVDFCHKFDVEDMLDGLIPYIVRPGLKEFTRKHPHAKWWTFTNKDRTVEGRLVRDVSDDEGLVGWFQTEPHEVSGRQVIDANKAALMVPRPRTPPLRPSPPPLRRMPRPLSASFLFSGRSCWTRRRTATWG